MLLSQEQQSEIINTYNVKNEHNGKFQKFKAHPKFKGVNFYNYKTTKQNNKQKNENATSRQNKPNFNRMDRDDQTSILYKK